jgi:hypothetical protein
MEEFLDQLDIRLIGYLHGKAIWRLESVLRYGGIVVPVNFETDLASVPRIPIIFMLWGDRVHKEAVLHDYLYRKNSVPFVTKDQADSIFKYAMKRKNPAYVYEPIYLGVKYGARKYYHKLPVEYHFSQDYYFIGA